MRRPAWAWPPTACCSGARATSSAPGRGRRPRPARSSSIRSRPCSARAESAPGKGRPGPGMRRAAHDPGQRQSAATFGHVTKDGATPDRVLEHLSTPCSTSRVSVITPTGAPRRRTASARPTRSACSDGRTGPAGGRQPSPSGRAPARRRLGDVASLRSRPALLEPGPRLAGGLRHAAAHRARRRLQSRLPTPGRAREARRHAARQPDVPVNVAGGGRARAGRWHRAAAASSYLTAARGEVVLMGEVGLTGEVMGDRYRSQGEGGGRAGLHEAVCPRATSPTPASCAAGPRRGDHP